MSMATWTQLSIGLMCFAVTAAVGTLVFSITPNALLIVCVLMGIAGWATTEWVDSFK